MGYIEKEVPEKEMVYSGGDPFKAKVLSNEFLTVGETDNDVHHIVLDLTGSGMSYTEGQNLGIVWSSPDNPTGPFQRRLYSIASSRAGDDGSFKTVSIKRQSR